MRTNNVVYVLKVFSTWRVSNGGLCYTVVPTSRNITLCDAIGMRYTVMYCIRKKNCDKKLIYFESKKFL